MIVSREVFAIASDGGRIARPGSGADRARKRRRRAGAGGPEPEVSYRVDVAVVGDAGPEPDRPPPAGRPVIPRPTP